MSTEFTAPEPAPADIESRIDGDLVAAGLAGYLEEVEPILFEALMDRQISWALTGIDALGVATIDIVHNHTGERLAAAKVHWSSIVRPG